MLTVDDTLFYLANSSARRLECNGGTQSRYEFLKSREKVGGQMTLDELDTEPASALTVPRGGIWRVPGARNGHFTGRESVLTELRQNFLRHLEKPAVQAIVGMGGVGKTQIAGEYAWRHREQYGVVWWLPADDPTTLALSYAELAKRLGLGGMEAANLDAVRHSLRRALVGLRNWLLIFDNAPSAAAVRDYLPLVRSGDVLITSRDTEYADVADGYPVPVMERWESIEFLTQRVGQKEKEKIVGRVAQALGDHPLAMEQAGAHIVESRINFATYLLRFETHWAELLAEGSGLATPGAEYPDSLAMSLELSFRQLEETQPPAQALLNLFSFFAGESIPAWIMETVVSMGDDVPVGLMPLVMDQECRDDALAALRRYSLVEGDDDNLHVHRLVSALARRRLSTVEKAELASISLRIVTSAFDFDSQNPQTWEACTAVLPHAMAVALHAESLGIEQESAAKTMNAVGRFLMRQNRLVEAREALTAALNLAKKIHGPYHARLAGMSNDLGRVLQKQGDAVGAREYFEKSLAIEKNIYGENETHAASVINNYGMTLHADGDFQAAQEHFERALAACESEHGPAHWRVALVRNNLGCVLRDGGDTAGAREQFQLAMESARNGCGEMHPVIAQIAFNLGNLFRAGGDWQAAQELIEKALQVDRHNHGAVHPDIARDLMELGAISRVAGDAAAATRYEEQARAMLEATK
jgi:Tfp pilus assembly protein PilF